MIIFSELRRVSKGVQVEEQIWNALALVEGMKYYLSLTENHDGSSGNEILCTAVHPRHWRDLWHFKIAMLDRPGLLAELTSLLREAQIDIVNCRAETTEPNGIVNVEMHLDSYLYTAKGGQRIGVTESGAGPTLPQIRARIIATFIEEIIFFDQHPLFSLWRVLPLSMSANRVLAQEVVTLGNRSIQITENLLRRIRAAVEAHFPGLIDRGELPIMAAVRADTEATIVRIMLLYPFTGHVALRIRAANQVGTLAAIADYMRHGGFNMVQMWTYNCEDPDISITDVILQVPDHAQRFPDEARMAEQLARIIQSKVSPVSLVEVLWSGV
jgi:hypothetical protein